MTIEGLKWFSNIHMGTLRDITSLLGKDIQLHSKGQAVKTKYADPYSEITANLAALENINSVVTEKGPFATNPDGSTKVNDQAQVEFINELNDFKVFKILLSTIDAAKRILSSSHKEFSEKNDKGLRLLQLQKICQEMLTSHTQTQQKMQLYFYTEHFKKSINAEMPYEPTKIQWFAPAKINSLEESLQQLQRKLSTDPAVTSLPPKDPVKTEPPKQLADQHLLPDVAEAKPDKNPVINALNTIAACLQQLKNINAKVSELGAYAVVEKKGEFKFEYSDHRLEDTKIVTLGNNITNAIMQIESLVPKGSPEYEAVQNLKFNKIFADHSAQKNFYNQEFFRQYYQNTTPAPAISVVEPPTPIIVSSRDIGLVDKIKNYEPQLATKGWTISETKSADRDPIREVIKNDGGVEKKFIIDKRQMRTSTNDLETFKTMLECFQATHNKLPVIKTSSPELKEKWIAAIKEVFPERKIDFDSMITIKKTAAAASPAPDPDPEPEPEKNSEHRVSMRH
jgi:hypothetical protein